ncbi:MAG: transcriptional repressor [Prevotella sp.]|nr:transcriptional repressor [Prevotella sp.]
MAENNMFDKAKQMLDSYLKTAGMRKTPERDAILSAIYDMNGHFSVELLNEKLEEQKFIVSRATLYNTLRLFLKIHLVVRHKLVDKTTYEAALLNDSHCHQICTLCGKVVEIELPGVEAVLEQTHLRRFRKEGFTLYVYGICSSCQSKLTRRQRLLKERK